MQMHYRGYEIVLAADPSPLCTEAAYRIYRVGQFDTGAVMASSVQGAFSSAEQAQLHALVRAEEWIDRHLAADAIKARTRIGSNTCLKGSAVVAARKPPRTTPRIDR